MPLTNCRLTDHASQLAEQLFVLSAFLSYIEDTVRGTVMDSLEIYT